MSEPVKVMRPLGALDAADAILFSAELIKELCEDLEHALNSAYEIGGKAPSDARRLHRDLAPVRLARQMAMDALEGIDG